MTDRKFLKLTFPVPAAEQEKWVAVLSMAGCYGFEEEEKALHAFIEPGDFEETLFRQELEEFLPGESVTYKQEVIEEEDWNATWEKGFVGITIENFCQIIPPFKEPAPGFAYTIVIDPRMAFGTGHHQTTRLMVRQANELDLTGANVLDMGCGTGILSILAEKMGAREVTAVDFDSWAVNNTLENAGINGCSKIFVIPSDTAAATKGNFGIIFANINRRVLLAEAEALKDALAPEGKLLLSGICDTDISIIMERFGSIGFRVEKQLEEDEWVSLRLVLKGE